MTRPDVILQYCQYDDYPIFRRNLSKYRHRFNKVILYMSKHHGFRDFGDFSKDQIKETWVEPVPIDYGKEDWRMAEVTPCLKHVESEWVYFMEQDFFVEDWDKFYTDVEKLSTECDMFGWAQNDTRPYIHPCSLFIKRELLDRTSKDFSAHPEVLDSDHFAQITQDAIKLGAKIIKFQDIGYNNWENAFHMQGLTYPYQNWSTDRIFGVTNPEAFFVYNYFSRLAPVPQDPRYIELSWEIHDYMVRNLGMEKINPEESRFKKFYV